MDDTDGTEAEHVNDADSLPDLLSEEEEVGTCWRALGLAALLLPPSAAVLQLLS